jgi:hypothetical protein
MRNCIAMVFISLFSFTVFAQSSLKLKQVLPERDRAVAESTEQVAPGTELIALLSDGRQCSLKALSQSANLVTLDLSACPLRDQLRAGLTLESSLLPLPTPAAAAENRIAPEAPPSSEKPPVRFSLALGYNTANSVKFDSISASVGSISATGNYEMQTDAAAFISASAMMARENSWGFVAGLTYESKRNINSESCSVSRSLTGLVSDTLTT